MDSYQEQVNQELKKWQRKMTKRPSVTGRLTKGVQTKFNNLYPEKFHEIMTVTIKKMVQGVLFGSEFISNAPIMKGVSLIEREDLVRQKINFYKKAAAAEGAGTGAGGIFLGLADFPLLLSIKIKLLFDLAPLYGFNVRELRERLYILYIFQLAFSSEKRKNEVYHHLLNWDRYVERFPVTIDSIDWRTFQQEYRDYIDLAKMLQLMPGIGAVVGAWANYRLVDKLGETGMNCYRMRILE
ncbi:MAG: EcsC family protein [Dehalobacterium sp.]